MTRPARLVIRRFRPPDQAAAQALVLAGLAEHWGTLDPTLNPDLDDIAAAYADGCFLVAQVANRIAGTGALLSRTPKTAEIVRMSVADDYRRLGIGAALVRSLCVEAQRWGCRRVILETTASWHGVMAFYRRCGFRKTHDAQTAFGPIVYFTLDLGVGV